MFHLKNIICVVPTQRSNVPQISYKSKHYVYSIYCWSTHNNTKQLKKILALVTPGSVLFNNNKLTAFIQLFQSRLHVGLEDYRPVQRTTDRSRGQQTGLADYRPVQRTTDRSSGLQTGLDYPGTPQQLISMETKEQRTAALSPLLWPSLPRSAGPASPPASHH